MVREDKGAKDRTLYVDEGQLDDPGKWKDRQMEKVGAGKDITPNTLLPHEPLSEDVKIRLM